jgi:hypothetical protein
MQTQDFLTYSIPRLIGQHADTSLTQIDSYVAENVIGFGMPVIRGADPSKQVKPSGTEYTKTFGIAIRNDLRPEGEYPADTMVSVITFGRVVVRVNEAVKAGDKAYVHANNVFSKTAAAGHQVGLFASNQDTLNELAILEISNIGEQ